jgi:LPXTG-site transpeptidase (sortase) family protein
MRTQIIPPKLNSQKGTPIKAATSFTRQAVRRLNRNWVFGLIVGGGLALVLATIGPTLLARFATIDPVVKEETSAQSGLEDRNAVIANRIIITSLGIDAPIIYTDSTTEAGFQEALRQGVVHYPGTALPGQPGNSYLFGHSSDLPWSKGQYKTVFAKLPDIKNGDEIKVSNQRGEAFVYRVFETRIIDPKDTSVLAQDKSRRILSVQTSYPVGTAQKRFLAIAELAP